MKANKVLGGLAWNACLALTLMMTPASSAHAGTASQMVGLERTGPNTFSIDVEGADIRTVCRAISEFSGRNIVVANMVKGEVTIVLHNVAWDDALRTVVRSLGLEYVDEDGILRVDEASKLRTEQTEREAAYAKQLEVLPLETRIIKLK